MLWLSAAKKVVMLASWHTWYLEIRSRNDY